MKKREVDNLEIENKRRNLNTKKYVLVSIYARGRKRKETALESSRYETKKGMSQR